MKTPHFACKWVGFFGLVLSIIFPVHAARENTVGNFSPKTGTNLIVVRNRASTPIDVIVGDQVAYNFPHFTNRVFESTQLYEPPYAIEVVLRSPSFDGTHIRFTNPNSETSYQTPDQSFKIVTHKSITGVERQIERSFRARYHWTGDYWVITIQTPLI